MTDAQVSPSRTVKIGKDSHKLDGAFATLRAIQEHFGQDIVEIVTRIMEMRLDETAALIAIGVGRPHETDAIGQAIVDELGLSTAYILLKTQLYAWLMVALAPKADREKKVQQVEEIIAKARAVSPGATTSASPSDPSDGSPASSGAPTSGS